MSDIDDQPDNVSEAGGDDLFGDAGGSGDDASQIEDNDPIPSDDDDDLPFGNARRRTPARDSASQRDDRSDKAHSPDPGVSLHQDRVVEIDVPRHGLPKTKDGNMQLAKVPPFLRFIPELYDQDAYKPSRWDIANSKRRIPINFVRYRRNHETGKLESNANIYKWSDGSMTMQVGEEHYEIQRKAQVPPPNKAYNPDRDAHRYIAAAQSNAEQILTVAHINEEWAIRPDKQRIDEDTELLREKMGLAKGGLREGEMIITTNQDPELQKKQAELAEKERLRAQRRRENAQMRIEGGGGSYRKGGGLSIGDLEAGRRSTAGRKRGAGVSAKRSQSRYNDEYDSDDDLPPGGRRDDDYDKGDDFIASSDEEIVEGGSDDDDILDDGDDVIEERPRAKRQRTAEPSNDEADADGDLDDSAPAAAGDHGRRRVRRVVSSEDEDE